MRVSELTASAFTSAVVCRCDDDEVANLVDVLFRIAPYSGCESARTKGLGMTRLTTPVRKRSRNHLKE